MRFEFEKEPKEELKKEERSKTRISEPEFLYSVKKKEHHSQLSKTSTGESSFVEVIPKKPNFSTKLSEVPILISSEGDGTSLSERKNIRCA